MVNTVIRFAAEAATLSSMITRNSKAVLLRGLTMAEAGVITGYLTFGTELNLPCPMRYIRVPE